MKTSIPARSHKKPASDVRSTVLVIDDSEEMCTALQELLELEGLTVVTRSSGASGLRELQAGRRFGLVLMDCDLEDMTAEELMFELQSQNLADQQPIVGLARSSRISKSPSQLAAVIRKPVDVVDLLKQIRSYLTLH